jgi:phenylacetate-coenzyme A ligase PaaK-like adenylate-forming protein
VPVGQLGKRVLITNLANRVQPLIRYEVGDMVALTDEPCRCGSQLPKIAQIKGRTADEFWFEIDGAPRNVSGLLFKNALDTVWEVHEWQAVQEERNHINLRLQLLPGAKPERGTLGRSIVNRLHASGLPGEVQMDVEYVKLLEPDPKTHKLRRVVSKFAKPQAERAPRVAAEVLH